MAAKLLRVFRNPHETFVEICPELSLTFSLAAINFTTRLLLLREGRKRGREERGKREGGREGGVLKREERRVVNLGQPASGKQEAICFERCLFRSDLREIEGREGGFFIRRL